MLLVFSFHVLTLLTCILYHGLSARTRVARSPAISSVNLLANGISSVACWSACTNTMQLFCGLYFTFTTCAPS
ncbi:hypothetical protein AcV7_001122 [Taiwanofungus camphoratus]|nr:hypothetical protein AcV7_001122 [Antrodia cinnamomea]